MNFESFQAVTAKLSYGKRLPGAVYLVRPSQQDIPTSLWDTIRRAELAAQPDQAWNLLKLHTDQFAITFLSYPNFETDPHPALVEATRINLNSGSVMRTDYRARSNPPILHRKETFLPPTHPKRLEFSSLTLQEENAGLLKDTTRIGHQAFWLHLLSQKRLGFEGHRLVNLEFPGTAPEPLETDTAPTIERHRTAIKRYDLSKPVKILLELGLLRKGDTFFDYGCGHGMDIEALSNLGYIATGWDPAFRPHGQKATSSVVNLGYVLNVIENAAERITTLRDAFALAERLLIVSTMVTGQETESHSRAYRDGFLTKANTFQKFFAPGELESLIEENLGLEVITLGLGICVVFRDPEEAELFESSRNRRRIDWSEIGTQLKFAVPASRQTRNVSRYELHKELLDQFWNTLLELGRLPEPGEFDRLSELKKVAGGIKRALALILSHRGDQVWQMARMARSEDALVYLAMTNFRKRILRREIPFRIRNDIRAFFGDVISAQSKARELLFAAGDPDEVALAVEGLDYGVYDPKEQHFTFHKSFLNRLPPILRVYVQCAAIRYGNPEEADLIKIHVRSGKLTFLIYENFTKKEPILQTRIKINLRTQFVQVFDHSNQGQELRDKRQFFRAKG